MIVWGVPIHPLVGVAFVASVVLLIGGIRSATRPESGRRVAIVGIAGLGALAAPWLIDLVPRHNVSYSPIAYIFVGGYIALVAFGLFFPAPFKLSIPIFAFLLLTGAGAFALTHQKYVSLGEYNRPRVDCVRWYPEPQNQIVPTKFSEEALTPEIIRFLEQAGIHGTLKWR